MLRRPERRDPAPGAAALTRAGFAIGRRTVRSQVLARLGNCIPHAPRSGERRRARMGESAAESTMATLAMPRSQLRPRRARRSQRAAVCAAVRLAFARCWMHHDFYLQATRIRIPLACANTEPAQGISGKELPCACRTLPRHRHRNVHSFIRIMLTPGSSLLTGSRSIPFSHAAAACCTQRNHRLVTNTNAGVIITALRRDNIIKSPSSLNRYPPSSPHGKRFPAVPDSPLLGRRKNINCQHCSSRRLQLVRGGLHCYVLAMLPIGIRHSRERHRRSRRGRGPSCCGFLGPCGCFGPGGSRSWRNVTIAVTKQL